MLKPALKILALSWVVGCTPIPLSTGTSPQPPRPVAPLPVETMKPKGLPSSPIGDRPNPAKSGKPAQRLTPLSAAAVKAVLEQAEDRSISAANLEQSAQTKEDWQLVLSQWQRAIALLRNIPPTSPQKALVQQRLASYQGQLARAKQASKSSAQPVNVAPEPPSSGRAIPLILSPGGSPSPSPSASPTASPDAKTSPASSGQPLPSPQPSQTP
jgi:hypothetical protein